MTERSIAIIPARGGSRRLPRKNLADFLGRPIIAWTIEAALASGCFDAVIVSTDDGDIAAAAAAAGADTLARPAALAGDDTTVVEVCLHALAVEGEAGRQRRSLCCLYPTAPLRRADDIRAVMALLEPGHCDFAMAVTRPAYPPHQALRLEDGALQPLWPELVAQRTAALGDLVVDNGSTYAVDAAAFGAQRTFYGEGLRGHVMPPARSVDIDVEDDLELARYYGARALAACGS